MVSSTLSFELRIQPQKSICKARNRTVNNLPNANNVAPSLSGVTISTVNSHWWDYRLHPEHTSLREDAGNTQHVSSERPSPSRRCPAEPERCGPSHDLYRRGSSRLEISTKEMVNFSYDHAMPTLTQFRNFPHHFITVSVRVFQEFPFCSPMHNDFDVLTSCTVLEVNRDIHE